MSDCNIQLCVISLPLNIYRGLQTINLGLLITNTIDSGFDLNHVKIA